MDVVDRFPLFPLIFCFVLYPLAATVVLRWLPGKIRTQCFAALNVAGLAVVCWLSAAANVRVAKLLPYTRAALFFFCLYVGVVLLHYVVLRMSQRPGRERESSFWTPAAFFLPLVLLAYVKYASDALNPFGAILAPIGLSRFVFFFVGISYLSFRLVHLVQEVRNEVVQMPTLSEYLSFAFFVPTLLVGPINPYSKFIGSYRDPQRMKGQTREALLRIVVGFTKYFFLGSLTAQFAYDGLLRDGHPHAPIDLLIAVVAYPVYLFCNFSGFCDMAIGVSGLLGIEVAENFDRPFHARNIQEFWTRWHITLSTWIRDLLFTPLSKALIRRFGPKSANHCIAAAIVVSFLLVGVWHGKTLNFLVFGAWHGVGIATVHYYTVWLKKKLGRNGFVAYRENRVIRAVAVCMNFAFFAFTLFFFANTWAQMHAIFSSLK